MLTRMSWFRKITNAIEKCMPYLIFFLTPTYYAFMMTIIRREVVEYYQMGPLKHSLHILFSIYCFINVAGNMFMSIITDTVSRKYSQDPNSRFCAQCNVHQPPKSWHCAKCNVCVLKRDHHCFMFSCCIGLKNQRYYVIYLAHLAFSMFYSSYYIYYFVVAKFDQQGLMLSAFRIINPFLRYLIKEPWSIRDMYLCFLCMNTGIIIWSVGLLMFHLRNLLMGLTAHEARDMDMKVIRAHWKKNMEAVFGTKWYWAILWPFAHSPLPKHA